MEDLVYLFPFVFVGMFVGAAFIISKKGWSHLSNRYHFEGEFTGDRIGIISATINGANYRNCLLLKYDYNGFYLRPIFVFRLFHKPIYIPWKEIKKVRDKKVLFTEMIEMQIGEPAVAVIELTPGTYSKIGRFLHLA